MGPQAYGYARPLAGDQDLSPQLSALRAFGIGEGRIVTDASQDGKGGHPSYERLVGSLRPGDTLVVKSLFCLGEGGGAVAGQWGRVIKGRKADVVVLDVPLLDTRAAPYSGNGALVADLVPQLLRSVAEAERASRGRRQAEGIARAQARGVHTGRSALERPDDFVRVYEAYRDHEITRRDAAAGLGVSCATFDKWVREARGGETSPA